jgi:hypothetical protein
LCGDDGPLRGWGTLPLQFGPDLCFVGLAARAWLQNIDFRDLAWKISGINDLENFEWFPARWGTKSEEAALCAALLFDLLIPL